MTVAASPITWFGGKSRLAEEISSLLPPHRIYVEVFGGGGSVIFTKHAAHLDVYNDVDDGLVNFFTVLRDHPDELQEKLRLTPYARHEYLLCRKTWLKVKDPIERARRWYFAIVVSFDSVGRTTGWKAGTEINHAETFITKVEDLKRFAMKLRRIQVDHRSWQHCIEIYDSDDTVFYCDPPYLPSTRQSGKYRHEMTAMGHRKLLQTLIDCKGSVLLSGYDSKLYRDMLEPEFERFTYDLALQADLKSKGERQRRTEVIWRRSRVPLSLLDLLSSSE